MKQIVFILSMVFLCSCSHQSKQHDFDKAKQDSIQLAEKIKKELAEQEAAVRAEKERAEQEALEREERERAEQEAAERAEQERAEQEAAAERARNEEMIAKLSDIEGRINYIRNGEFSRSMQSVLNFRRKGTHRLDVNYALTRKDVKDSCNELIELYQSAMAICGDYGRMDLYNLYADEIVKLNNILDEL